MKTTIRELGKQAEKIKKQKPIELVSILMDNLEISLANDSHIILRDERFITLICKNYTEDEMDLFLIHSTEDPSKDDKSTVLCMGHWNDGVVD